MKKIIRVSVDRNDPSSFPKGFVNKKLLDATTERLIKFHQQQDDAEAMLDAAQYAKGVRERIGLSQQEFSKRIEVSLDTIRNWEQGKRSPTGAAKALLKILDRAPEIALLALSVQSLISAPLIKMPSNCQAFLFDSSTETALSQSLQVTLGI